MNDDRRTAAIRNAAALAIVGLIAFSEHLAFNRIFQVDELQYVFTARLLATHQAGQYYASANLMLLGPMTWLAGAIDRAALLLRSERLLFFALFWVNLCLIVRCAGYRLRSASGIFALFLVATLAPLWDYGFEIRHDNLLLTMILLAWLFARPLAPDGRRRLVLVGFFAVIAQFCAFKAFVYVIPIIVFAAIAAWLEEKRPIWRIAGALLGGALLGLAAGATAHLLAGTWSFFSADTKNLGGATLKTMRFSPLHALSRLVPQTPVLLAAVLCAAVVALRNARRYGVASRESMLPEAALLAVAIVAIFANPTPFPYNLVLLVPQAAIFCLRLRPLEWSSSRAWRAALAVALALHLITWFVATQRHLFMSNGRQMVLATTAEEMTDPQRHAVFDGAGLVPTRHPPGRTWLIHTFTIEAFRNGTLPPIRSQLAEGKTPVIIPNYRTSWLAPEDGRYIAKHYVELAGDFLVAGTVVPPAGAMQWDCPVEGRYYVDSGSEGMLVDGRKLGPGPLVLEKGMHTLQRITPEKGAVIWLGPKLQVPPALGPGHWSRVFVNFY